MENDNQLSVWPLMVDMLTSILIVFILFSFFDDLLNRESIDQALADARRLAFVNVFDQNFDYEIKENQIAREADLNYLKVTFSDKILFTTGNYALNDKGKRILNKLAPIIKEAQVKNNIFRIQVEGHTDDIPLNKEYYPRNNWELSTARAISVVEHLSQQKQISEQLFSANGYGPHRPIDENERDKNRRIEIKIFFSEK